MTEVTGTVTMWTAIAGVLTLMLNLGHSAWKEHRADQRRERERKWEIEDRARDLEDREKLAVKVEDEAKALALKVVTEAAAVAKLVKENALKLEAQSTNHTARLGLAIKENTGLTAKTKEAADRAYDAANNFALKLDTKEDKK